MVSDTVIIIVCVVVIVLTIGCGITYCCCKGRRAAKPEYQISDNYSNVASEFVFDQTKNSKAWLGNEGIKKHQNEQRKERLQREYDLYAAAMRVATNYCRDPSLRGGQRKIRDDLPCIGYRNEVTFFYPVSDDKLEKEIIGDAVLLLHMDLNQCPPCSPNILDITEVSQPLGSLRCLDFAVDEQLRAFRLTLESLDHPFIANTYDVGLSRDKKHLFLFRDFFARGSLRDHIYNADLSQPYSEKYNRRGKGLPLPLVRKYGRQLLEAMRYLSRCGLLHFHLHTGNVLICYKGDNWNKSRRGGGGSSSSSKKDPYDGSGTIKVTGIENNFLGLLPRHPYYKHIVTLKKLYPSLNAELMMFGYILFEMTCGIESPMPSPLDAMHEAEVQMNKPVPKAVKEVLGRIFGDKSFGSSVTLDDLIALPFFAGFETPPINTETYDALRGENEFVEKMRNVSVMQCYYTYSRQALLGEMDVAAGKKRKKRKKKKKNREKSGKMAKSFTSSQRGGSLLVDTSLLDDEYDDDDDDEDLF